MRKLKFLGVALCVASAMLSCEKELDSNIQENSESLTAVEAKAGKWKKVFQDDFNNLGNWQRTNRKDFNSTICNYRSNNPKIVGGSNKFLQLTGTSDGNGQYSSGHVKSKKKFGPKKNEELRFESRIRFEAIEGKKKRPFVNTYGAWPAFWTVEEKCWPTKGEMDIMESYTFGSAGKARYASNFFFGTKCNTAAASGNERYYNVNPSKWVKYQFFWKNDNGVVTMRVVVNGKEEAFYDNSSNPAVNFEKFGTHNIIFNLNIGSDFNLFDNSKINLFTETRMFVDYVSVFKRSI